MMTLLVIIHILVCFVLIMVVLLQSGKAADLAGAFGGGGSQTALGSRGAATFLTKATTTAAVLFMITSLGLALLGSRRSGSVLEDAPAPAAAPAEPGAAGGAAATPETGAVPTEPAPAGEKTGDTPTADPAGSKNPG
jgi:preprotein translocase subunit SecG